MKCLTLDTGTAESPARANAMIPASIQAVTMPQRPIMSALFSLLVSTLRSRTAKEMAAKPSTRYTVTKFAIKAYIPTRVRASTTPTRPECKATYRFGLGDLLGRETPRMLSQTMFDCHCRCCDVCNAADLFGVSSDALHPAQNPSN